MPRAGRVLLSVLVSAAVAAGCHWYLSRDATFARDVSTDGNTVWITSWLAPRSDVYEISVAAPVADVFLDNALVQRAGADDPRAVWSDGGWHRVRVIATSPSAMAAPPVRIGRTGDAGVELADLTISQEPPKSPALHTAARVGRFAGWLLAAAGLVALVITFWRNYRTGLRLASAIYLPVERAAKLERTAVFLGLAIILTYGAFLRFDAITLKYGPVSSPAWLHDLQSTRGRDSVLRPAAMTWDRVEGRYISDPYTYLIHAREMRNFYAASRREPLFPAATRAWLWLLSNQDVAVSFASATFSMLLIAATFLLGREAFSPLVGLAAALFTAIEYEFVTLGVSGWRDDAFSCGVVLSAFAMLRYARTGSPAAALAAGFVGGLSCLVRITSLSFLIPGLLWLLVAARAPWRARLTNVAAAAIVMLTVIGPFLITCWQTYGDPLYSINVHADVYREAAGENVSTHQTAATYLKDQWRSRPVEMLATFLHGMTAYPFANKWTGFARWTPWLGPLLSWLAIAGLAAWIATASGRLLLVVLASSLLPYSMTWKLGADWRFTEHAYPFFLIAAPSAVWLLVQAVQTARAASSVAIRRSLSWGLVWAGALVVAWFAVVRTLPNVILREQLQRGEGVNFEARETSTDFVGNGWSRPFGAGNVVSRVLLQTAGTLHLALPEARAYDMTLRLDPFPRPFLDAESPPRAVNVAMNGQRLGTIDMQWTPDRVGAYTLQIPAGAVRTGTNTLALETVAPRTISLWHVRVRPSGK